MRIDLLPIPGVRPVVFDEDVIATGFPELASSSAVVLGPTGLALSRSGTLYVADTQANRIAAIPNADRREFPIEGGGITVSSGGDLNAPLGMTLTPRGDILTANGNDGLVVETTPSGKQIASLDTGFGSGALFGLTIPRTAGPCTSSTTATTPWGRSSPDQARWGPIWRIGPLARTRARRPDRIPAGVSASGREFDALVPPHRSRTS